MAKRKNIQCERFDEWEVSPCTAAIETEGRNSPSIAQCLSKLRIVPCRRQPKGRASGRAAMPRRGSRLCKNIMLGLSGLLIAALPLLAKTGPVGVYTYNYIDNGDGTVTLSRYDADGYWVDEPISPAPVGEFTVPEMIDGKLVAAMGSDVFNGMNLTSIIIPAGVTNLSIWTFGNTYNLTNITVASDNPVYKSVDGVLYTKDGKTLVAWPQGTGGNVVVVSGTECIGDAAFNNNYKLTSVFLPNGLKTIENDAFAYCQNLDFTSVTIPASVETIGDYAFRNCSNLSTVSFLGSEGDIDIADTAFAGTPYDAMKPFSLIINEYGNLVGIHGTAPENLVLADYLNGHTLTCIAGNALSAESYNTASMTNIVVPEGVAWIDGYAFYGCAALESVTLPTSLQSIGYGAFSYCTSLRTIRIPAGVASVNNAFYGCENLTVTAPSTLRDSFSVPEEDGCRIEYYEVPVLRNPLRRGI